MRKNYFMLIILLIGFGDAYSQRFQVFGGKVEFLEGAYNVKTLDSLLSTDLKYNELYEKLHTCSDRDTQVYTALKMIELKPDCYLGYQMAGMVLNTIGRKDESCPYFLKGWELRDTLCALYARDICRPLMDERIKGTFDLIREEKYKEFYNTIVSLRSESPKGFFLSEWYLTYIGWGMFNGGFYVNDSKQESFRIGLEFFKVITRLYPDSYRAFDSLGEAYVENGDTALAIQNFKKSLELDPTNLHAKWYIQELTK